jgi:hypothetical protein
MGLGLILRRRVQSCPRGGRQLLRRVCRQAWLNWPDVDGHRRKGTSRCFAVELNTRSVTRFIWTSHAVLEAGAAEELNDFLCARTAPERFACMICCYYEPKTTALRSPLPA